MTTQLKVGLPLWRVQHFSWELVGQNIWNPNYLGHKVTKSLLSKYFGLVQFCWPLKLVFSSLASFWRRTQQHFYVRQAVYIGLHSCQTGKAISKVTVMGWDDKGLWTQALSLRTKTAAFKLVCIPGGTCWLSKGVCADGFKEVSFQSLQCYLFFFFNTPWEQTCTHIYPSVESNCGGLWQDIILLVAKVIFRKFYFGQGSFKD